MPELFALAYLAKRLVESSDPLETLFALNSLEQAGLVAIATLVVYFWKKLKK